MVIVPANKNVTCSARKTTWTLGATYVLQDQNDYILKQTKIWFSPGCAGKVQIKVDLNGTQIIPDTLNSYSDAYIGDDDIVPIYISKQLHQSDKLDIYYINNDYSDHKISVFYELQPVPIQNIQITQVSQQPTLTQPSIALAPPQAIPQSTDVIRPQAIVINPNDPRVADESQRSYVGDWEKDLDSWLKTPGLPEELIHDPRKLRRRN